MLSVPSDSYTLAELSQVLPFSRNTIQTLVKRGAIRAERHGRSNRFPKQEIKLFLENCLRAVTTSAVHVTPANEVEILGVESEALADRQEEHGVEESRTAERYLPRIPVEARFGSIDVRAVQLSASGVRIHHARPLRIGTEQRLALQSPTSGKIRVVRGRVTWSRLATSIDASRGLDYVSGIHVIENAVFLPELISELKQREAVEAEGDDTLRRKAAVIREKLRKREQMRNTAPLPLASPQERMIGAAIDRICANPVEAQQWFNRAKYALAQESVRQIVPQNIRQRDEALAVWESLGRNVDLRVVCRMVAERE